MKLTTIGTGTAAPSPSRVNAGYLVEAGGVRLLLDCGSGVVHRMAGLGIDWMGITHVAVTHFHADHTSDLPSLLFAWRWGALPPRSAPAQVIGPPGTDALLGKMADVFGRGVRYPDFPLEVRELPPGAAVELEDGVVLEAHAVPHTAESVAYCVRRGGRRLVYTGDTGPDAALAEWASGCDVLLCECSLPEELAIPSHLTPARCAELAAAARPGMLVLTHFYPPVEAVDVRGVIAEQYRGEIALAVDGWSIEIEEH
ncbi:MAG TPA: ribonuclease Z [Gemmatimonadaceae bacterium]|nr:ribonuclease Z [Gemmatimonadaceae bacterium]